MATPTSLLELTSWVNSIWENILKINFFFFLAQPSWDQHLFHFRSSRFQNWSDCVDQSIFGIVCLFDKCIGVPVNEREFWVAAKNKSIIQLSAEQELMLKRGTIEAPIKVTSADQPQCASNMHFSMLKASQLIGPDSCSRIKIHFNSPLHSAEVACYPTIGVEEWFNCHPLGFCTWDEAGPTCSSSKFIRLSTMIKLGFILYTPHLKMLMGKILMWSNRRFLALWLWQTSPRVP